MRLVFDLSPLSEPRLTGVGYFTSRLVTSLLTSVPEGDYLGYTMGGKIAQFNIPVIDVRQPPGLLKKANSALRYIGIEIPLNSYLGLPENSVVIGSNFLIPPTGTRGAISIPIIHDLCFEDHPEWVQPRNGYILRKMLPRTLGRSSGAIVISGFTADRLKTVYGYKKPILQIGIPPLPTTKRTLRPNLVQENERYVLFVGTIEPRKNIKLLLDSFERIIDKDLKLVLVGKAGWDSDSLERIERMSGKVIYLGYVDEAERNWLYKNSIATIVPSHYEGFGMMALESISAGSPVILSDIPPHREILNDAGLYFDPKDTDQLLVALKTVMKPKNRQKPIRTQARVLKNYSWESNAKDIVSFCKDIINE